MTNYEHLKTLPLYETAEALINLPLCTICKHNTTYYECSGAQCLQIAVEWLKSQRENEA